MKETIIIDNKPYIRPMTAKACDNIDLCFKCYYNDVGLHNQSDCIMRTILLYLEE